MFASRKHMYAVLIQILTNSKNNNLQTSLDINNDGTILVSLQGSTNGNYAATFTGNITVYEYLNNNWVKINDTIAGPYVSSGVTKDVRVKCSKDGLIFGYNTPSAQYSGTVGKTEIYNFEKKKFTVDVSGVKNLIVGSDGIVVGDSSGNDASFNVVDINTLNLTTNLNKSKVGLNNVDNTTDVDKPVSSAQQTALNLKANIESPTFTGTVYSSGNVGIGTSSPCQKLHIKQIATHSSGAGTCIPLTLESTRSGGSGIWSTTSINFKLLGAGGGVVNNFIGNALFGDSLEYGIGIGSGTDIVNGTKHMWIENTGYVGIGTTSPRAGLEVITTKSTNGNLGIADETVSYLANYSNNNILSYDFNSNNFDVSIIGSGLIYAASYVGASDERIKHSIRDISDNRSLLKLRDISCCWYGYKDIKKKGNKPTVGFIAQQVKSHFPEAVSLITDIIPNEMRVLDVSWNGLEVALFPFWRQQ